MKTEYCVYILRSIKDGKFYTGFTDNINRRLAQHDKGNISTKSTLNRGPFEMIHVEVVNSRLEARTLEKYFKSGSGREVRDEIYANMVDVAQW
ncbi:MAG TPA: endonuclease [Candidatus Levybacteria bacterium]|nr:endonuclease [Candidatus Levybacteria bacterium]